jgi:trehalose-6-phosphate synthase
VFFLHAPFPTAELLRSLSTRDALLEGLLANDVLGFHSFALARHFMEVRPPPPPVHNTRSMCCVCLVDA